MSAPASAAASSGEEIAVAQIRSVLEEGRGVAGAHLHPSANGAPQSTGIAKRVQGSGALGNVIGNPLETTHRARAPDLRGHARQVPEPENLRAHGGGFLPSYAARMDHGCSVFPDQCKGPTLKKKPSEYLKQLYFDSLVFTGEALRHLVAEHGASQIMIGTDYAVPWVKGPVDHVLNTPASRDDDKHRHPRRQRREADQAAGVAPSFGSKGPRSWHSLQISGSRAAGAISENR